MSRASARLFAIAKGSGAVPWPRADPRHIGRTDAWLSGVQGAAVETELEQWIRARLRGEALKTGRPLNAPWRANKAR